jgi:hypothetical protein
MRVQALEAGTAHRCSRRIIDPFIEERDMTHRTRHKGGTTRGQQSAQTATRTRQQRAGGQGEAAQGASTRGTLSSGHSSHSATGGTGGDVLQQRGSGYSAGNDSRVGARPGESGELVAEGVAPGAAGFRSGTATGGLKPGASGAEEEEMGTDGGAAVIGVSGVSGGGRGTTSANNTRK